MRLRLLLSFGLIILVTLASMFFFAYQARQEVRAYTFMLRGGMASSSEVVVELEAYYAANGGWNGVDNLFLSPGMHGGMGMGQGMMGGAGGQRVRLADGGGRFVYDSQNKIPTGSITLGQKQTANALRGPGGQTVGYLLVEGGTEIALLSRLGAAARNSVLVAGGVALVLALLLAYGLIRPVRDLTEAAARMAKGDLSQRVRVKGSDEVGSLGDAFNHMAESLEKAERSRRAMTADIAHELRTPLAVQRAQLEALQDGIYPLTLENLQPLVEQNTQLNRLVDDLRTLALAEGGELQLECKPTDFPDLVRRILDRFQPQADAKETRLDFSMGSGSTCPPLDVDPGRIEQILSNLISNALRYTPAGGSISASLRCEPNQAVLEIRDSGPGIPEESLPYVFDRFYRADRSRSRSDGGTGLGLAIARQLARAHHGDLTARNSPDGGAVFTLNLPL